MRTRTIGGERVTRRIAQKREELAGLNVDDVALAIL
jgi:hypothetical protein